MSKLSKSISKTATQPLKDTPKPVLSVIKDIQRQIRRQYTAEEKIRIVLEGLRGEVSVAEICPAPAYRTGRA